MWIHSGLETAFDSRNIEARPHVGPLLAQCAPSLRQAYRERMPDTMLLCRSTDRLGIFYLSDYSAAHCNYLSLRMTNRPAYKGTIMHRTDGLVEPRCNTIQGGQWRYKSRQIALVAGFYWQYNDDDAQLLNNAGIMQAVAYPLCLVQSY